MKFLVWKMEQLVLSVLMRTYFSYFSAIVTRSRAKEVADEEGDELIDQLGGQEVYQNFEGTYEVGNEENVEIQNRYH